MDTLKSRGKRLLCNVLEWQVKRLRKRHQFAVIAVVGSVGKTSTKLAIARVIARQKRVRYQEGNYNDRLTVPLVLFGHQNPNLFNLFAWAKILISNERQIRGRYPYDIVVTELGTDAPGQIKQFAYLKPQLSVVTAVSAEHMEFFGSLEAVAEEELAVHTFSAQLLINADDTDGAFLRDVGLYQRYGTTSASYEYHAAAKKTASPLNGREMDFKLNGSKLHASTMLLGEQGLKVALAAAAAAHIVGINSKHIADGVAALQPFAGRMQILQGVKGSVIIDDTYNASPLAVKAALDVLYSLKAPQRIAILGSMNELGEHSQSAHKEVGEYCDPEKLDLVLTVGADAATYLAPAAMKRGCEVRTFVSPYEAGDYAFEHMEPGAVLLAKGSQNRVFTEESLKILLDDKEDWQKLVRQSEFWLNAKREQFPEGFES